MSIRIKALSYTGMLVISLLVFVLTASLFTIAATGDVHGIRDFIKCTTRLTRSRNKRSLFSSN